MFIHITTTLPYLLMTSDIKKQTHNIYSIFMYSTIYDSVYKILKNIITENIYLFYMIWWKIRKKKIFRSNAYVRIAQTPQNPKYKNRITLNGARFSHLFPWNVCNISVYFCVSLPYISSDTIWLSFALKARWLINVFVYDLLH